ncbi:predicted protein [Streptomyces filamentosus NRRL 15998]|uniref:Predicted protein n=1 Tax=Streptomyces filamentosus NRRL 15998 TaxID=457431 RepID=D6AJD3_STRFL|nr:predicted protein [Streptomyces filamentosus NRRL 15998]
MILREIFVPSRKRPYEKGAGRLESRGDVREWIPDRKADAGVGNAPQ